MPELATAPPEQKSITGSGSKIKVLFLDIDGVVNRRENFNPANGRSLYPIDRYCAFLVGKIKLDTGCEVVLSSSWRHHPDGVEAVEKDVVPIIDITPTLRGIRGTEIQKWLDEHPEVERYAILDDDSDMLVSQAPNFFKTTFEDGLTKEIADAVTEHLNA